MREEHADAFLGELAKFVSNDVSLVLTVLLSRLFNLSMSLLHQETMDFLCVLVLNKSDILAPFFQ